MSHLKKKTNTTVLFITVNLKIPILDLQQWRVVNWQILFLLLRNTSLKTHSSYKSFSWPMKEKEIKESRVGDFFTDVVFWVNFQWMLQADHVTLGQQVTSVTFITIDVNWTNKTSLQTDTRKTNLGWSPNLMHIILIYLHIIHLLKSSTCFEHYPAHLQEVYVVIVHMQPLVSSLCKK